MFRAHRWNLGTETRVYLQRISTGTVNNHAY